MRKDMEHKEQFDDFLNEAYPKIKFGVCEYEPADVLENVDPVVYWQFYLDYCDSEGLEP